VLNALLSALSRVEPDLADLYCDLVLAALPRAAQRYLEELMAAGTYEYQSDFARRYFSQGKAEGRAEAVLAVLEARGIEVPAAARARIVECSDPDQLDSWIRLAATAESVHALFDE
jgi:hypothetical protein